MKKILNVIAAVLVGILVLNNSGFGQSTYKVKETKDFDIKISGTSTLHDWEMTALKSTGEAQFRIKSGSNGNEFISIKSLSFAVQVKDLKSDDDGLNKNAYEALKSEKHKDIRYKLTSSAISSEKDGYLIKSKGSLTIAGVTKEIHMDVHGVVNVDATITFKGSYKLNMKEYKVEPPSFLWGAMTTGETITLEFKVVYKK